MAYYMITVQLTDGTIRKGVREDAISNIELYKEKARQKAKNAFRSSFRCIDVVMLSATSNEVRQYLIRTGKVLPPVAVRYDQVAPKEEQPYSYGLQSGFKKHMHKGG